MTDSASERPATIHQVASLAGVSHTTVSRYLQDKDSLKPKTRIKVEYAVKTLDYRPNLVARSMRTRHTNRLAIVLASGAHFPGRLLAAASRTAHDAGYQVEIVSVDGGARERSERIDELARSGQVEGILALSPISLKGKNAHRVPIVENGTYDDKLHGLAELADASEIREIIEYLVSLGHRRFLHVAGAQNFASARNRKSVYLETIERLGLESVGAVDGDWSAQSGFDAITALPADCRVTAVVAANDVVAMGVIRGALSRGWKVPDDLSVFGWDDEEIGRFATPSLSTVAVDREAQGRAAVHQLLAEIRGEPATRPMPRTINHLIYRESTAPPPRH
ncbi:DNA-binding LacI/PurR family transcriptional regulator [Kribbella sp. VKM Ac-2571]|uniref:LacI family DNA-binding transcriptional regulator n=1 Tax=Kribbella sp. VKM Ac-2571 TaxID=2512222 RepID=UPI00106213F3|nr:LacI family DNA-binding transcriptional regulator [Kribbella sp. VKM Ac-2571]TDO52953.1 DNA-binding LacI/PurR family transcriptional regulator [Kribbella sp. VKM Ac-2571]